MKSSQTSTSSYSRDDFDYGFVLKRMKLFHDEFRATYHYLLSNADNHAKTSGPNLIRFLNTALRLSEHIDMHHRYEERYFFPVLAQKMEAFSHSNSSTHIKEHKAIINQIHEYQAYLRKVRPKADGKSTYSPEDFKKYLTAFGERLFVHLDSEEASLSADNMKKFWTKEEIRNFFM